MEIQNPGAAQDRKRERRKENTDLSDETAVGDAAEALFSKVEMAKDEVLPHLTPPGEEEAVWFYHGISSTPRLVGRASAGLVRYETIEEQKEAWRRDPARSSWFITKEKGLAHIGMHGIRARWETVVEQGIKLAVSRLPWTSLDVVRLGDTQNSHADWPVVVWVGVEHHNVPWPKVTEALRACRLVLDDNGLRDVDVQIRESRVFSLVSRPSLLPINQFASQVLLNNVVRPFCTVIGNPVSPCAVPTSTGTLGVYISPSIAAGSNDNDGTAPPPVWAITCRHVGLPNDLNKDNKCCRPSAGEDAPNYNFFIPSDKVTTESIKVLGNFREDLETVAKSSGLDKDWASFRQAHDAYEKVLAFQDRDARVSGAVFFSPPIAAAQSPITWTKDYCLLAMDEAKFPAGEAVTNVIDIRQLGDLPFHYDLRDAQRINQPGFKFPRDGLVKIQGLIPLAEIRSPPGPFENHMQDACMVVMKQGATTGLTFGCPSELMSTVRSCLPDGGQIETREWAIPGSFQDKHVAFSKAGDSGAAIVGLDGRLGGILTRGAGSDAGKSVDITYASPAVLVLKDIEEELGHPVVVL